MYPQDKQVGLENVRNVANNNVLVLPDPLARPVQAVAADEADGEEVVGWAEAARGEGALWGFFRCGAAWVFVVVVFACGGID